MTKTLLSSIGKRLQKPEALREVTLETLKDENNFLPITETHIGIEAMTLLNDLLGSNDSGTTISKSQHKTFLKAAGKFYKSSIEYVITKMDVNNELWQHAVWIEFFNGKNALWSYVNYFVKKYSELLSFSELVL